MNKFRCITKTFWNNVLREVGDVVEAPELPSPHFEPVGAQKPEGKPRGRGKALADVTDKPGKDNPETLADMAGEPGESIL